MAAEEKTVFSALSQAAQAAAAAGGPGGSQRGGAGGARKRKSSPPPAPRVVREGSSFADCPLCGRAVARSLLEAHINECVGDDGGAAAAAPKLAPAAAPRPPTPPPAVDDADANAGPSTSARPSALTELMRAGRAAARVHVFFAERRGGAWFWWWFDAARPPAGLPPVAWSADVAVPLPGRTAGGAAPGGKRGPKATVRLATNVPPAPPGTAPPGPPPPARLGASILKSALQKNVRLGRVDAAAVTAAALARLDAGELARRLPIIMIEDAALHPALPHAVWTMAAIGKGYAPPPPSVATLVRLAAAVAAAPVRDDPGAWPDVSEGTEGWLDGLFEGGGTPADDGPALLVRCLHFRGAYGGMPCDVAMMRTAATVWAGRFAGALEAPPPRSLPKHDDDASSSSWSAWVGAAAAAGPLPPPPPPGAPDPWARPLAPADVPLAAIDFHVSEIVADLLLIPAVAAEAAAAAVGGGGGDTKEDALRAAMWVFRSGRNVRPRLAPLPVGAATAEKDERDVLRPLWRVARSAADAWSADFVRGRFAGVG